MGKGGRSLVVSGAGAAARDKRTCVVCVAGVAGVLLLRSASLPETRLGETNRGDGEVCDKRRGKPAIAKKLFGKLGSSVSMPDPSVKDLLKASVSGVSSLCFVGLGLFGSLDCLGVAHEGNPNVACESVRAPDIREIKKQSHIISS